MAEIGGMEGVMRLPEARYSYYRRCQEFRRNGEQCKAPAEKGSQICHAHAGQRTTAFRRDLERRIVLAEAVAEMRRQGKPECETANLFTDFKGIQVTLAVVSRAIIAGRIDCKTAGRLLMGLQMASKLLRMVHRKGREGRKENQGLPDFRRRAQIGQKSGSGIAPSTNGVHIGCQTRYRCRRLQVMFKANVSMFPSSRRGCRDGPWEEARAREINMRRAMNLVLLSGC